MITCEEQGWTLQDECPTESYLLDAGIYSFFLGTVNVLFPFQNVGQNLTKPLFQEIQLDFCFFPLPGEDPLLPEGNFLFGSSKVSLERFAFLNLDIFEKN